MKKHKNAGEMNSQNEEWPSEYPAEWKVDFGPAAPLHEGYQVGSDNAPGGGDAVLKVPVVDNPRAP
jgi:hypothetical protein